MAGVWFRKTTEFSYDTCIDELKHQVHELIDKNIRYLYQSSSYGTYSFQFAVSQSLPLTRNTYVKNIPRDVYFESVHRVLYPHAYILYPNGGQHDIWYTVCVVQTTTSIRPISVRLARAAIRVAQDADENCAITLEPLRTITAFAVSHCGHVFSEVAAELPTCPLCKSAATWTVCGS
jgi:hypothetical protein